MSISGFSWSDEREHNFNLSDYYYAGHNEDAQVLITLAENAGRFASAGDLVGARIGAQKSSIQRDLTVDQLSDSELIQFTNLDDAVNLLLQGEFDCIAVADGNADAIIASHPEIIKSGFRFEITEKQIGNIILLRKGSDELTELVNNILKKAEMYYETWYADARATAGIETSYDDEGNPITD
jgi:polar amino acid transport system substrate-binding protein